MKETMSMSMLPANRIFDAVILTAVFVFNSWLLHVDWPNVLIVIIGSLSGAVMLAYFRREARRGETLFKVLAAAIGGLVLGTVFQEYFRIESAAYRLGLFFFCSMLALVVLRAVLASTEKNAADMVKLALQRALGLHTPQEKRNSRLRGRQKTESEEN